MSVLTSSQLTFCDLKDSYSIHMDTDCIGLACNNDGSVLESQTVKIKYCALMGSTRVKASCTISDSDCPSGVTASATSASDSQDGEIVFSIDKDATLGNKVSSSVKVVFKTLDSEQFTFEKYITFVKYMIGASGADAITLKVYSNQGFVFKEDINELELKVIAFKGQNIIDDATYTWEWWNTTLNDGAGGFETIVENTSEQSIVIYKGDKYALAHLKCTMTYDGKTYEDYADLTNEIVIYSSVVKFFSGSNIFGPGAPYLIAYIDLYRNNSLVETISTTRYYDGNTSVSNGIITTDISGEFEDGSLVYFIHNDNGYNIVLGKYQAGSWAVVDSANQYVYLNDVYRGITSNVIVISKNDVATSKDINFTIYKNIQDDTGNYVYNDDTYVSTTHTIIVDTNDPIISDTEPSSANYGQLWLDTSSTPYILKVYTKIDGEDTGKWTYFSQQSGGAVYTSKPDSYAVGDLWILADGEKCGIFNHGTMLRATVSSDVFNELHWEDAMDIADTITNIKESFSWNNNGIQVAKRVADSDGDITTPFYVHIDSTRMGFHSVEYGDGNIVKNDTEVVHIGNNSATIQNATFDGDNGTTFENNAVFQQQVVLRKPDKPVGFAWTVEANNSFSLTIV